MTTARSVSPPPRAGRISPGGNDKAKDEPDPGPSLESASGLQQLAKVLGSVAAPTALVTALLYYFGWNHSGWFFQYFGVNANVLGLSTVDYLIYSEDALFVPITVGALVGLLALSGHRLLRAGIAAAILTPRRLAIFLAGTATLGLLLTTGGFISVLTSTPLSRVLTAAPLSLAAGVLLLAYSDHLWRTSPARSPSTGTKPDPAAVAQWAIVFVLVAVSLFWAAADYSAAVGTRRAHLLVSQLSTYPDVVVYSQRSLNLTAPGVRQTRCHDAQAAYSFRYDGLKLVLRSGDQYLFLPQTWTPAHGAAVLLPRDASVRLEFFRSAAHQDATC